MAFIEFIVVFCGLYGAYATASNRRRQRQLGFIVFTVGAAASIPLYIHKDLMMMLFMGIVYFGLDIRGIINNRKQ